MRGDHLSVHYQGFYHHGIDAGDGQVIHMSREHGGIVCTSYNEFADGKRVHTENSPRDYDRKQVLKRARSRLGEGGYHLLNNNCEHFANWCRNGQQCSRQVHNVSKALGRQMTKSGAKTLAHLGSKELGKTGSKLLAKSGAQTGAKTLAKTVSKGGGLFIAADLAQAGMEQLGGNLGLSQDEAEVAGKTIGAMGHIAAGASVGGPLGAAAGLALWGAGELFGGLFD